MGWYDDLFIKTETRQQDAPERPLPKTLNAAEKQYIDAEKSQLQAKLKFLEGNEALVKEHGLESPITWREVEKLQIDYRVEHERLAVTRRKEIRNFPENPNYDLHSAREKILGFEKLHDRIETLEERVPKTSWQMSDNFKKFLDNSARENTQLDPSTNTPKELALDLLSKNRGLAFGDCHFEDEAPKLLKNMMKDLKAAGVDTLYIEFDRKNFDFLQNLSDKQLHDLADGEKVNGAKLKTTKQISSQYGGVHCDNSPKYHAEMFLEARKNGVEIVNIDGRISCDIYLNLIQRMPHTNLEWADAIKQDRAQNHKTGKYIVWGGSAHFMDMGAVDDALGIPSIAYDKSFSPFGFEAKKDSGFDFTLRGGLDHEDRDKARRVRPTDLPIPPQEERTK